MNVSIRIDVTDNFLPMDALLCDARHLTQNDSVTLGKNGSPKLMETNSEREYRGVARGGRRRAYNVDDIYYGALRNYCHKYAFIRKREKLFITRCALSLMRIKITLLVHFARAHFLTYSFTRHRHFFFFFFFFIRHACVIPIRS